MKKSWSDYWASSSGSKEFIKRQGKLADLVLLDANPLADIKNSRKINAVVLNGRLLNRSALDAMLSQIEAARNKRRQ